MSFGKVRLNSRIESWLGCMLGALCVVLCTKNLHLLARTGVWKISSETSGYSSIKIDYSDCPKSLISRINEVYVFSIEYRYSYILLKKQQHKLHLSRLFCCNHTCYCVNIVSVTSVSRYITSASRYHPRYQSRSSMYSRRLIPRNFAELADAVPIDDI